MKPHIFPASSRNILLQTMLRVFSSVILCASTALLHAAEPSPSTTDTYAPDSLEVPTFTPPLPVEPKVPLPDAKVTVVCRDDKGQTVIVQRGGASMAPDLPAPEPPAEPSLTPPPEEPQIRVLHINMTGAVYDHQVTSVRWQHPVTKAPYEAVLGFDLGLVAQLHTFMREGVPCQSTIFCNSIDTKGPLAQVAAAHGRPPAIVPQIEPDGYSITQGNPVDADGIEPLLAVRDIYLAEKTRLQQLSIDRKNYQQDAKAWADAHPAPVAPTVFWFKPHRNSRYLTPQDKANQEQAAQDRAAQTEEGEAP